MSSTRRVTPTAAAFRQPKPYVNIEQRPRKDDGGGVMNNENVNPSSLFTTPLTASTRDGGGTVKPTVAFTTTTQEEDEEEDAFFSGEDDEEQETERDEDEDANPGAEPPAGRDNTPVSTADLQPAIERHFNESTNANSGERSIRRRRRLHRLGGILQQYQNHHHSERNGGGKKHITAAAADSGVAGFCEGYNIEQRSCNMFECTEVAPSAAHKSAQLRPESSADVLANDVNAQHHRVAPVATGGGLKSGGGYIAVYIDCRWANSFVLSRGAIELPQYPVIEAGHDIELGQLTLVPGDTAVRLQCGTDTIPITDIENRQVTSYFEGIN
ncbi:hypothetical protein quinque_002070 [Culex quinquefasciatus]